MRTTTMAGRLAATATILLLVGACSAGSGTADPVDLETDGDVAEQQADDDPDDGDDAGDGSEADGADADDAGAGEDPAAAADADDEQTGTDTATTSADGSTDTQDTAGSGDGLVDLTEAVPGTWPVGDAGTVTFSIVGGALSLDDVRAADGWDVDIDEQDADEIEVDFRRDDVEWEIEIELEDGATILAIEIDQDIEDADPGSYDLGDAGSFSFQVDRGRLVVTDLSIADGWTVVERDEEADEIEIELVNGPRQIDVEVELDDGVIEVEIDYEVTGPVSG